MRVVRWLKSVARQIWRYIEVITLIAYTASVSVLVFSLGERGIAAATITYIIATFALGAISSYKADSG
jgi:hypothetical protein